MLPRFEFENFPIGFCDCGENLPLFKVDRREVELWHDCAINTVISPQFDCDNPEHVAKIKTVLDDCLDLGVKVLLNIPKLAYYYWPGAEKYRALFARVNGTLGQHPAVLGYFLGDEPHGDAMGTCTELYNIVTELAPEKCPYLNLNPGQFADGGAFAASGCRMLSYDCYSQMNKDWEGLEFFYKNLVSYADMARKADIPLLSIVLGTAHFRYQVPTEDDLRWQLGICLALGSNALFWFTFHTPAHANYRNGAIDAFGDKTPTYDAMRRVHKQFFRDYADLLNHARVVQAYWQVNTVRGLPPYQQGLPADMPIAGKVLNVFSDHGTPAVISFLRGVGKYAGREFIMVLNNTTDRVDKFALYVDPAVRHLWLCRGENWLDYEFNHPDAHVDRKPDKVIAGLHLAPGQFEIFAID